MLSVKPYSAHITAKGEKEDERKKIGDENDSSFVFPSPLYLTEFSFSFLKKESIFATKKIDRSIESFIFVRFFSPCALFRENVNWQRRRLEDKGRKKNRREHGSSNEHEGGKKWNKKGITVSS